MSTSISIGRRTLIAGTGAAAVAAALGKPAIAATKTFKVGVLGVMSGPDASWGLVNKYCAMATANMYNASGGFPIGDDKYHIEVIPVDTELDPKLAIAGAERLAEQLRVHYVIGPNTDGVAVSVAPMMNRNNTIFVAYSFVRKLYTAPAQNAILGMIASFESGSIIYKYLMEKRGVRSISFLASNDQNGLNSQGYGAAAAEKLNLKILSAHATYQPGATDFFAVLSPLVRQKPDLLVLSGVAPATSPLILKAARQLGYKGLISTETAQNIEVLKQGAGTYAEGFISVGGASTPAIESDYMKHFAKEYQKVAGEWDDEAGTKAYALEMILHTIAKAGPKAIGDTNAFKAEISSFEIPNPFMKGHPPLRYVGADYFMQKHQIGVPLVVTEVKNGAFETLFIGSVS